jgi:ankyrin repeat protein/L-ascorbate metabolism protein UlaG (beta-lactamase superfamily)
MKKITVFAIALVFLAANAAFIMCDKEYAKILDENDTAKIMKMLSEQPDLLKKDLGIGMNTLHYAAYYGNDAVLDYALKNGIELNYKDTRGRPAIYFAVSGGKPEMVKKLISLGADPKCKLERDETLLFRASMVGNLDTINLLIENGLDVNAKNQYGQTPIINAIQSNKLDVVKYFKSKGVNLKQGEGEGLSFLHFAVFSKNPEMIKYLLDEGLNINATGEKGETPLYLAVNFGAPEVAKILAEKGADVNAKDNSGITPFSFAVNRGEKDLADLFIKHKANVNAADKNAGRTVLHEAAARGYSAIVDLLLKNGADKDAKDKNGYTALSYAVKYGNKEAAEILKKSKVEYVKWDENLGYSEYLTKSMNDGEAYVWYLKHSGWAVKTKSALLIFDYWDDAPSPDTKLLANGHINVEEIKNLPVYVFASHEHGDHFDKQISEWKKTIPNIKYIFGFKNDETAGAIYTEPRSQQKIDNLTVTTIKSNDAGVGFAVQVDGLTLFHAGDHSNNTLEEPNDFFPEIDFLAEKGIKADVAFYLNMYGCGSTNPEAFSKGIFYALDKLQTKAVFPMHASYKEWVYQNLADDVAKAKKPVAVGVASISGDRFHYSEGTLKK